MNERKAKSSSAVRDAQDASGRVEYVSQGKSYLLFVSVHERRVEPSSNPGASRDSSRCLLGITWVDRSTKLKPAFGFWQLQIEPGEYAPAAKHSIQRPPNLQFKHIMPSKNVRESPFRIVS